MTDQVFQIRQLTDEHQPPESGKQSIVLHDDTNTKVVLFAFAAGSGLTEHVAPFPAIIQIISGEAALTVANESVAGEAEHMGSDGGKDPALYQGGVACFDAPDVAEVKNPMMNSRTITCSINCPLSDVYKFASNPENLPQWVQSFCLSVKNCGDEWQMETPTGWVGIRFVPANELGVLDHVVLLPDGQSILNPMRVVANGDGCEIKFTLFQRPEMDDQQFANDAEMVEADLRTLKVVMESTN